MSLVKERPIVRRATARPVRTTQTINRARPRPIRRPRSGALTKSILLVGMVTLGSYVASSVLGNTLLESARRDRIRSVERTKDSREDVARLRRVLDSMVSLDAVSRYAMAQGMELSGAPVPRPQTVVAQIGNHAQVQ
ncbi:MAG: hypothetical protein JNK63_01530 [Chthonomonas sp.]|nr:hypothetical protein [Chthonomonas sp.]